MPDPTFSIPEHYPRQYAEQFAHQIQQVESRFKPVWNIDPTWTAKEKVYRDLSKNTWVQNNSRFGTTNPREGQYSFRKAYKRKVDAEPIHFDQWDEALLDRIVLPTSEEMQAQKMGYERIVDDLHIAAATEDSLGGVEPHVTAQAFPASQIVHVGYRKPDTANGSNIGLTAWKVMKAKTMFKKLDLNLDQEEVCLAADPDDLDYLMLSAEAAANEPWAKRILKFFEAYETGNKEARLLGCFRVIETNRLATASSIRTCLAFCKSGFVMSTASEVKSSMDRIPTENNKLLIQSTALVGIGRRYDEKVVQIPCAY